MRLRVLDQALARGVRQAAEHMACRAGCDECCHGPFPIPLDDAARLYRGVAKLAAADPARAAAIIERACRAIVALAPDFPGDATRGLISADDAVVETFCDSHAALACPALDPASGTCDVYAHRPVACRTYGLPLTIAGESHAPCRLCFTSATPEHIEQARVDVDACGSRRGSRDSTLIAYALVMRLRGAA